MMLYLGTNVKVPGIEWNDNQPSFNVAELSEEDSCVSFHFSLPFISYIGSDHGCGCGFKHAILHNEKWMPVIEENTIENENQNQNQRLLFNYIKNYLSDQEFIEIYGCWDGDFAENTKVRMEVQLFELLSTDFYFLERGLYIVQIN